jgi:hypothetical protein
MYGLMLVAVSANLPTMVNARLEPAILQNDRIPCVTLTLRVKYPLNTGLLERDPETLRLHIGSRPFIPRVVFY